MRYARNFMLLAGILAAYALADLIISAAVRTNGSSHSWEAVTAFSAAAGGFVAVLIAYAFMARLTFAGGRRPRRIVALEPPVAPRPVAMPRRVLPWCHFCADVEARKPETMTEAVQAAGMLINPYTAHRDCWVTTGSEKELERMLRHVNWEPS